MEPKDLLLIAGGILFIAERWMGPSWSASYWSAGIILFRRRCKAPDPQPTLPRPESLQLHFTEADWPQLDFWHIGTDRYAFAEDNSNTKHAYTQVMHGYVAFHRDEGMVEVVGLLNYYVLLFGLGVVALAASRVEATIVTGLLLFAFYLIQSMRYDQVLSAAMTEWSRRR